MEVHVSNSLKELAQLWPVDLYIVGGYVRNSLMDIQTEDIDICSSLKIEDIDKLLKGTNFSLKVKSKLLGSCLITSKEGEIYEYTCFRKDFYPENGQHSPEKVEFIDDIKEDAKRRDFTCNAVYYDIKNNKLIDFYDGIIDIERKILRAVENPKVVFENDGVRILRLFRFQCELNFKIDKDTLAGAIEYQNNLRDISGDRVVNEITKILHSANRYPNYSKPNAYLNTLNEFNKAKLWPIFGIDCPKIKFNMVKKTKRKSKGFLIDVIDTVKPISISYYLNLILSESFGLNKKMVEQYINIISGYYEALNRQQNKPYFFKYFNNFPEIYELLVHKSKSLANKYNFFYKYIISHKLIISVKELKISGEDIKKNYPEVKPNRYKPILESLLSDIFDGILRNDKKELIEAVDKKLKYL